MAAKTVRKKATAPRKRAVKVTDVNSESVMSVPQVKRGKLTARQKLVVLVIVLVLGYLLFSAKELIVAATVNGQPISRLRVVSELEKQGGKEVLESLVNEALIVQEAKKAGVAASEDEINAKVDEFKTQIEGQGQELDALLTSQGLTQEDFRKQIKIQIYLEKLLADRIEVKDEEVKTFLETNKEFLPTDQTEEQLNDLARKELSRQALSTKFSEWLTEVKAGAKVNYFVEY